MSRNSTLPEPPQLTGQQQIAGKIERVTTRIVCTIVAIGAVGFAALRVKESRAVIVGWFAALLEHLQSVPLAGWGLVIGWFILLALWQISATLRAILYELQRRP